MARRAKSPSVSAEGLLAHHSPLVRELAERLRQVIRQAVPEAVEKPNPGWHSLNYHYPACGYFCGLFPRADDVQMAFEFGALLPDPHGLLTGDGLQVRFVVVRRKGDIRVRAITQLLREAIALPESRDVKLALIRAGAKPTPARHKP